jgi:acetyl-CoA synthetase
LKTQSAKFANVLKKLKIKRGTCFLANGRIPELYVTALGTLKYTAVFCPLFSVFGPEPIYQRVSKGDVTILITTLNLYEKSKTISGATPSLYIILTDAAEHLSDKILSFPHS